MEQEFENEQMRALHEILEKYPWAANYLDEVWDVERIAQHTDTFEDACFIITARSYLRDMVNHYAPEEISGESDQGEV